ncbi:hypothetical protein ALP45_02738 [Pseudomonas coronafaciens pv. atropurpurea]|uniref:hypothetical protein n=1 Tax=Pseudomonas coronafaciens TaxID=53409 RepID=UPI0006D62890|nr:hypothetical protein [Pseudomonas coronafaciens]KPW34537.1 Uncharacterized protein ALO66_01001 [Pseudomonas coronafaciens pv. atropurpurea]RMT56769.1 hypothetical protein ALP45_02738 [Pseudomonas coronafaciens pv. atropurpurea]
MIEPKFLSVPELACRWNATERQILEHGSHLTVPIFFLFDGLAFCQADRWLMEHGATDENSELENKRILVNEWEQLLRRNAAGLTDKYSRMDHDQVLDLRSVITEYEVRIEALTELLSDRSKRRKTKSAYGYLRLLPRSIADIQSQGSIPFPHMAISQIGELMTLEPGISGRWRETLSAGDLLIPLADVKAIEANNQQTAEAVIKRIPKTTEQERVVLEAMRALGYEPSAIPRTEQGKPGARRDVWQALKSRTDLFVSQGVFNKAWERLRGSGEIVDEQE